MSTGKNMHQEVFPREKMIGIAKFLLVLAVAVEESIETLHSGFTACKVNDPNFELCLDNAIENGVKFVKNGLPDYHMLPLDPLTLDTLKIGAGAGAVHLEQNYQDVMLTGFSDLKVNNSRINFDKKILTFSTMNPLITHNSKYDINGKILMLPVHGKGLCNLVMENCFSNHLIEFDEKKIGNDVFYIPEKYTLRFNPNHARYRFDNLFDGNKLLGDNINKVINEEWQTIFEDVGEGYAMAYSKIFLEYTKKVFEKTPVNEIFIQ